MDADTPWRIAPFGMLATQWFCCVLRPLVRQGVDVLQIDDDDYCLGQCWDTYDAISNNKHYNAYAKSPMSIVNNLFADYEDGYTGGPSPVMVIAETILEKAGDDDSSPAIISCDTQREQIRIEYNTCIGLDYDQARSLSGSGITRPGAIANLKDSIRYSGVKAMAIADSQGNRRLTIHKLLERDEIISTMGGVAPYQSLQVLKDFLALTEQLEISFLNDLQDEVRSAANKEGCYIATAVYASYDAPEVITLRKFRDECLARTVAGQIFIRCYYKLSPHLARRIRETSCTARVVRRILDSIVWRLDKSSSFR